MTTYEALTLLERAPSCYQDNTEYARTIGYRDSKPVIVSDGRVVTHNNTYWSEFCQQQREKAKGHYDMVFLADNEWGNQIMREVAEEYFAQHPECNFVQIYEHAGWSLGYHRSMEVIATANDLAVMRPDRPRPTGYSGRSSRRPVIRPDINEVTTLKQYV